MAINKQTLSSFRQDFAETIKALEDKYGMSIKLGSISYDDTSFTSKLNCNEIPKDGKSVDQIGFDKYCLLYDLAKTDFDKPIWIVKDQVAFIKTIKPNYTKYPIIVQTMTGKRLKISVSTAKRMLSEYQAK